MKPDSRAHFNHQDLEGSEDEAWDPEHDHWVAVGSFGGRIHIESLPDLPAPRADVAKASLDLSRFVAFPPRPMFWTEDVAAKCVKHGFASLEC